nr:MAG TPA: Short C-terminal domain [Caudoviricetes sp.]
METIKLLKRLYKEKKITRQAYSTYKGQVLSGKEEACLVGLKRKKLI